MPRVSSPYFVRARKSVSSPIRIKRSPVAGGPENQREQSVLSGCAAPSGCAREVPDSPARRRDFSRRAENKQPGERLGWGPAQQRPIVSARWVRRQEVLSHWIFLSRDRGRRIRK